LLTIGAFSRRVGLTPSALRFYDDCGLLCPARVDASTGYRWYAAEQQPRAHLLRSLRDVDLPLSEVRTVLDGSAEEAATVLRDHLGTVELKVSQARRAVADLLADLQGLQKPTRVSLSGPELSSAVRQVVPAAATTGEIAGLDCVLLELDEDELHVVATDRYRLSVRVLHPHAGSGPSRSLLVPAPALVDLAAWATREDVVELLADGDTVTLTGRSGGRPVPTTQADYPAYRQILDALETTTTRVIVDRTALLERLLGGDQEVVALDIGGDRLIVESPDGGDAQRLPAVCTGAAIRLGFAAPLLAKALTASVGPDVLLELRGVDRPVVVRSADQGTFTTIAMPHRLEGTGR
jgi:DNA-binding transcriptional MerR regulator